MSTAPKLALISIALLGLLAAAAVWALDRYTAATLVLEEPTVVTVEPGQSLRSVAGMLAARDILPRPRWFVAYARLQGQAGSLRAGEYRLEPGLTVGGLLDRLVRGEVLLHSLTIVEGWTVGDMLAAVRAHPALSSSEAGSDAQMLMRALSEPDLPAEGLFFPDTYHFPRDTSDLTVLRQAREAMRRRLAAAWEERAEELPFEEPYQALILASMVEKETGLDEERPQIAGVFVRRLRRGMRLQSDPTVIYGLGERYDGNIRRRDLRGENPYNTYSRSGLPPTPIALPGAASIRAAVRPAETDALYFVATGEADGSHHFSATLQEHNEAVRRYLSRSRQGRRQ